MKAPVMLVAQEANDANAAAAAAKADAAAALSLEQAQQQQQQVHQSQHGDLSGVRLLLELMACCGSPTGLSAGRAAGLLSGCCPVTHTYRSL